MRKLFGDLFSRRGGKPAAQAPGPPSEAGFHPQNALEALLVEAVRDPAQRTRFQQALLAADLYAATPEAPADSGWRTTESGEELRLLNVEAPDGAPVAAVFTAEARVAEVFGAGAGYVRMKGEDLLGVVAGHGAWLNPGSPYSVHWTPDHVAAMLGRPVSRTVQQETQVLLGSPSERPEALIAALQSALGGDRRIGGAWLALAHWPDEDKQSWYLDVRTGLSADEVNALLAETFKTVDFAGRPLDMVVNGAGDEAGAGIQVAPVRRH